MKILFVIPSLGRGGAERVVINICNELVKNEMHRVSILIFQGDNLYKDEIDSRVNIVKVNIQLSFSIYKRNIFKIQEYIDYLDHFKPDIIHSHLYYADLLTHAFHYKKAQ